MSDIARAIDHLGAASDLLVMTDFDGTLAALARHPDAVVADPAALAALRALAAAPRTTVAVVSGRGRTDLARFVGHLPGVELVGGHGAERGEEVIVDPEREETLCRVVAALEGIAAVDAGAFVEVKATSAALHVRAVPADRGRDLIAHAVAGPGAMDGVRVIHGKEIVELSIADVDKGAAVAALRAEHPESVAVFIGDDVTDEHAFAALSPPDVTVKVGPGQTAAGLRLDDQPAVAVFLQALADRRSAD